MAEPSWADLLGIALTLVGFGWTLRQIYSARKSINRMSLNYLLAVAPQFKQIEADLDLAVEDGDRKQARVALVSFNYLASEISAILKRDNTASTNELSEKLRTAAHQAHTTKTSLMNNPTSDLAVTTKRIRQDVGQLAAEVLATVENIKLEAFK